MTGLIRASYKPGCSIFFVFQMGYVSESCVRTCHMWKKSIILKAKELGIDLEQDNKAVGRILDTIQNLEHKGYQFEAADGSFELLVREAGNKKKQFFTLESFRVLNEKTKDGSMMSEATVKIHIGDQRLIATAEGNGPINALDGDLRNAIQS